MNLKKTLAGLTAFICICATMPSEIISETVNFVSVYAADVTLTGKGSEGDFYCNYVNDEIVISGYFGIGSTVTVPVLMDSNAVNYVMCANNWLGVKTLNVSDKTTFIDDSCNIISRSTAIDTFSQYGITLNIGNFNEEYVSPSTGRCDAYSEYTLDNGVLTITPAEKSFSYPANPLTKIKDKIETVIIEDGVTSMPDCLFSGCSNLKSVTIPDSITEIDSNTFYGCTSLTSITIPESVTTIRYNAFNGCTNLETIIIPSSVTSIGDYAFEGTKWLSEKRAENPLVVYGSILIDGKECAGDVIIPDGITQIGRSAFRGCKDITSVTIPDSVIIIDNDAFSGCTGLMSINIPDSVKFIGTDNSSFFVSGADSGVFGDCTSLTSIEIPDSVTNLSIYLFNGCTGLESVTIPYSIISVNSCAFSNCSALKDVYYTGTEEDWCNVSIRDNNEYLNSANFHYYDTNEEELKTGTFGKNIRYKLDSDGNLRIFGHGDMPYCTSKKDSPFSENQNIKNVIIEEGVTNIASFAFYQCENLTSITITDSITSINSGAFYDCTGLTSIIIPDSVTSIGYDAFNGCTGLTSITIPDSVTSIDQYTFYGCTGLISITIPDSVTNIGNGTFSGCTGLTSITIPDSVTIIGYDAFNGCTGLTSITIPDSVTIIGDYAFSRCTGLTSITVPDSVTNIDAGTFSRCTGLTSITIPDSVTNIGAYAFSECTALTSIKIPDGVTRIERGAFKGCTGLTSIKIPDSVTRIDDNAFNGCTGFTSIAIPDSVTSIGKEVFIDCTSIESITIPQIGVNNFSKIFNNYSNIKSITLSDDVTSIKSIFNICTSLESIKVSGKNENYTSTNGILFSKDKSELVRYPMRLKNKTYKIPNSVTSIYSDAFNGCTSLTSITIPKGVTSIGSRAFNGCSGLTSMTIPNGVTSIDEEVFSGCTGLTSITIPDSVTSIGNNAFDGCTGLTSITIPDSVTSISSGYKEGAFINCTGITSITIPQIAVDNFSSLFYSSRIKSITLSDNVTSIGANTFSGCTGLTSITIPDSVTSIDKYAFKKCTILTSITIPQISIDDFNDLFYSSHIKSITLSDNVTSIKSLFNICTSLESIKVSDKNENYASENGVLFSKDKSELVRYPMALKNKAYKIPDSVASIGEKSFNGCTGLTSITIPDSVTSIDTYAFSGCTGLTSITIPDSVTSIYSYVFENCSDLTNVYYTGTEEDWNKILIEYNEELTNAAIHYNYVPDKNPPEIPEENPPEVPDEEVATSGSCGENVNWELDSEGTLRIFGNGDMYDFQSLILIDMYAPWKDNKSQIKKIVVENGVTSIGSQAFSDCINVTDVSLPESLRTIGHLSFDNCKSLTSIEIPHGVYEIDYNFRNCSSLKYVVLPVSIKEIKNDTFRKCTNLEEIHYAGTEKQWEDFFRFSDIIPSNVKFIPNSIGADPLYQGNWTVAGNCGKNVNWAYYSDDNVLRIYGKGEMYNYGNSSTTPWHEYLDKIKIITVESGVTSIGTSAFENCRSMTGIKIADTVNSIGTFAFNGCESLKAVSIPKNIKFIDAYSFSGCSSLTYIEIPENTKYIGDNAFEECTSLKKVYIPESITSIGYASFNDCTSLKSIYYSGNSDQWKNIPKSGLNECLKSVNFKFGKMTENEENAQQLRMALQEYENAMNEYVQEINKKSKADYYAAKKKKENYIEFMERDQASPERLLMFSFTDNDKEIQREVMEDAYEVLYDFLTDGIDKAITKELLKLDFDDEKHIIEIEASIVDNIYKLALEGGKSPAKGKGKHGYTVDLNITAGIFGARIGSGNITKDGHSYFVAHCTSMPEVKKIMNNYVDVLIDTAQDQTKKACTELWDYFCEVTYISEISNTVVKEAVSNMTEFLMKQGYGNLIKDLIMVRESYDEIQEYLTDDNYNLMKKLDSKNDDELNLLFKRLKKGSVTDKEISDEAISRSLKKIDSLRKNVAEMFYNYVYGLEEYTEKDIFKMLIQCPVDVDIFDMDNNIVGYVHGTEISYNDDIRIQLSDDVKIISLPKDMNYSFALNGTDEGTMNIMFKEIVDGEEISYTNFYGIPLSTETSYTQNIENGEIKPVQDDNGVEIEISEKMTSDNCETVNIEVSGNYGGDITGSGDYVHGDSVLLTAKEYKNYSFAGWYDDEENLISENNFFRFTALENEKVEARFEKVFREVAGSKWEISEKYHGNSDFYVYNGDDNLVDIAFSVFEQQTDSTVMTIEIDDSKFEIDTYDGTNYALENIEINDNDVVNIYDSENILVANMKLTDEKTAILGDVNGDGTVNLKDVVLVRRYIADGWSVDLDENVADVNNDGTVNLKDVVLIRRYIAGGWDIEI